VKQLVYKLPQDFLLKLKKIYPKNYTSIANTFLAKRQSSFRINYLKTDLRSLRKMLLEQRIRYKELPYPQGAFILKTPLRDFQKKDVYTQGFVYVQNISSMIPPLLLAPQSEDVILDLCAAPGAKTTQIASLAPGVQIIAIEKARNRYYKLLASIKTQGVEKIEVHILDSIWVRKKYPESFDKILADMPCSTEGRFLVTNPATFKYWKQRKVKEMEHKQKKLLAAAFYALKEGGELVYSTCTFSPEENEEVIDWFLKKHKEKVELMPIKIDLKNVVPGLTRWKDKKYISALTMTKRIIPDETCEGFFVAKLKKLSV